ncbi:MAG: hypothetical protein CW346_01510 [Bacillaceae bacterium]|nr:hypothetical protein [Bacillaceae bacterium]
MGTLAFPGLPDLGRTDRSKMKKLPGPHRTARHFHSLHKGCSTWRKIFIAEKKINHPEKRPAPQKAGRHRIRRRLPKSWPGHPMKNP